MCAWEHTVDPTPRMRGWILLVVAAVLLAAAARATGRGAELAVHLGLEPVEILDQETVVGNLDLDPLLDQADDVPPDGGELTLAVARGLAGERGAAAIATAVLGHVRRDLLGEVAVLRPLDVVENRGVIVVVLLVHQDGDEHLPSQTADPDGTIGRGQEADRVALLVTAGHRLRESAEVIPLLVRGGFRPLHPRVQCSVLLGVGKHCGGADGPLVGLLGLPVEEAVGHLLGLLLGLFGHEAEGVTRELLCCLLALLLVRDLLGRLARIPDALDLGPGRVGVVPAEAVGHAPPVRNALRRLGAVTAGHLALTAHGAEELLALSALRLGDEREFVLEHPRHPFDERPNRDFLIPAVVGPGLQHFLVGGVREDLGLLAGEIIELVKDLDEIRAQPVRRIPVEEDRPHRNLLGVVTAPDRVGRAARVVLAVLTHGGELGELAADEGLGPRRDNQMLLLLGADPQDGEHHGLCRGILGLLLGCGRKTLGLLGLEALLLLLVREALPLLLVCEALSLLLLE